MALSYKKHIKQNNSFVPVSEWTLAEDIELENGENAQNVFNMIVPVILVNDTLEDNKTMEFTDDSITEESTFEFYTSIYGTSPISAVVDGENHSLTLTFDNDVDEISVKVKVFND